MKNKYFLMKTGIKCGGEHTKIIMTVLYKTTYIVGILSFLFITWLIMRIFLVDQFTIPTSSMEPTLFPGDKVIVNKTIMGARLYTKFNFAKCGNNLTSCRMRGTRTIQHNDIVVFNYPFHRGRINFVINHVYVKRCIALPGDSISIVNGIYKNNNHQDTLGNTLMQQQLAKIREEEIDSTVLMKKHYDPHYFWTIKNMPALYVPRKGDIIHITPKEGYLYKLILEWETRKKITIDWEHGIVLADTKIYHNHKFLHNYYFVAGDNVTNSQDSRYWGVIPEEYIIGVVKYIIH